MSNAIYEASRLREIPSGRKGSGEDAQGKILRGGFCSHISHWEGARINAGLARLCDSDFASLCWKQIDHHHYHHNVHASMRQLSHYQILQLDWARDCWWVGGFCKSSTLRYCDDPCPKISSTSRETWSFLFSWLWQSFLLHCLILLTFGLPLSKQLQPFAETPWLRLHVQLRLQVF